jgi:serine/threonine protein kinase
VDVWALGYVFINMFTRVNAQRHQMGDAINVNVASVRNTKVAVAPAMKELIELLLAVNPRDRPTMAQVKQHAAFAGVDWTAVLSKSIPVPWRPPVEMCATTFDDAFTTIPVFEIVHDNCTVVTLLN